MLLSNVIWSYVSKKNGSKRKKKNQGLCVYTFSWDIYAYELHEKKKKEKHQEKNSQNFIFFSIKVVLPT